MTKDARLRLVGEVPASPTNPKAFYQPILALDTRRIVGYEALGRECTPSGVRSLGSYFNHSQVPRQDKIELERIIREQAIEELSRAGQGTRLFLNMQPDWIHDGGGLGAKSSLYLLRLLERYGVDPARICIEITEQGFEGQTADLLGALKPFRSAGCQIAVDDVGSRFSNLDRIAYIQPDLLKIDMNMVSQSAHHDGFYGVLRSLSAVSDGIGASLLMEGVETCEDLQRAVAAGAHYVQGFLFSGAEPIFAEPGRYTRLLDEELRKAWDLGTEAELRRWRQAQELADASEALLRTAGTGEEEFLVPLLEKLDPVCLRAFLCSSDGIQLSADYQRTASGWQRDEEYIGANWSWRPYFVYSSIELLEGRRFAISRPYMDLEKKGRVRTVSLPAGAGIFLIVDVREERRG